MSEWTNEGAMQTTVLRRCALRGLRRNRSPPLLRRPPLRSLPEVSELAVMRMAQDDVIASFF